MNNELLEREDPLCEGCQEEICVSEMPEDDIIYCPEPLEEELPEEPEEPEDTIICYEPPEEIEEISDEEPEEEYDD